jgi:hypothetical protein
MSRLRITLPLALLLAVPGLTPALAGARYATSDDDSERRSEAYREAQRALDRERWDDAAVIFGKIAEGSGPETDAALYWKAYADWKRKLKKESLDGLRQLMSAYPKSPWVDDAKALEQTIRDGKGANTAADADNEELKLYALDGLMQVEADKAVPVLERMLAGNASARIKERALFVLSQSDSPRAREILLRTARTGQPIALRCEAVKTLGIAGDPEDIAALAVIAKDAAAPPEVREAVIEAYLIADRSDELMGIARSDSDPRIRAKAIEALGASDALPALRQLWGSEKDPAVRAKLLEAFGIAGDVDTLAKAARESSDPQLRRKAIEGLAVSGSEATGSILRQLYREFSANEDKRRVVEALMVQGDAKTLIELLRAERDMSMKKIIVQQLSVMDDPEATRALLELLGEGS